MGTSVQLNIGTDNVIEISSLYDALVGSTSYINDAIVTVNVTEQTAIVPTAGSAVTSESAGVQTGIVVSGSTLVAGQKVFITGTVNFDGLATLQTGTSASKLIIDKAYVAETMSGNEAVFKVMPNGDNISLSYIAASNGIYRGVIPKNLDVNIGSSYYVYTTVVKGVYTAVSRVLYKADFLQG